jgi:hypothetical protein
VPIAGAGTRLASASVCATTAHIDGRLHCQSGRVCQTGTPFFVCLRAEEDGVAAWPGTSGTKQILFSTPLLHHGYIFQLSGL